MKLADITVKLKGFDYFLDNRYFICDKAVATAMDDTPEKVNLKIYDRDPKKKNTLKVDFLHNILEPHYSYKGEPSTIAYHALEEILGERPTTWIVVNIA